MNSPATYSIYLRIFSIPIISAIAPCLQIIFFGYPYGHDWIFELVRLEEYYAALQSGQILPYWGNNLYNGFGSPIFLYYAPLFNLISAFFLYTGFTLTSAANLTLICLMITAAIGMAGLIWEMNNRSTEPYALMASRIAAILYVFSPYLLANMMVRNADAEFTAMCLAPYPFWGLLMLHNDRRCGYALLSIGMMLSVLAHNLTALVIASTIIAVVIIRFISSKDFFLFLKSITSITTGIGMATWFWLPAIWLKDKVRIDEMMSDKFDYKNNFSSIFDLFSYDNFYSTGILPLAILLVCFFSLSKSNQKVSYGALTLTACLFLFLQFPISTFLWEHIPFMPLFQFTWRMMGPFSFVTVILASIIIVQYKLKSDLAALLLTLLVILNAIPLLKQYQAFPYNISNLIPYTINSNNIRTNNLPATVLDEYLPKGTDKSITQGVLFKENLFLSKPTITSKTIASNNQNLVIEYSSKKIFTLEFPLWNFITWQVIIDAADTIPLQNNTAGALLLKPPIGHHTLSLTQVQPTIRKIGYIVSILFIMIFCITIMHKPKEILKH